MYLAAQRRSPSSPIIRSVLRSTARSAIFSIGKTDGEDLLHALYDHVLDEPVPERLKALLRR